ncbi:unnamed protein product [Ixodes pacificus]
MKFALLLCLLCWLENPLPSCTGSHVQQGEPESFNEPKPSAQPLDRVVRTADPDNAKDTSGRDPYSDYRTLMALMGPRRHRYLHFGRKRALPLYSDAPVDQVEGSDDYIGDDYDASSAESLEDAMRWAKPYLEDGLHEDVVLSGAPEDGEVIRYKRDVSAASVRDDELNTNADQKKRPLIEVHDELARDGNAGLYLDRQEREKKSPNRMLHFGKRERHHESTQLGSDEAQGYIKRAINRILHFGKRIQDDATSDFQGDDYGWLSSGNKRAMNRIMHFGKREPEEILISDESSGPQIQIHGNDKKSINRILHFGKRKGNEAFDTDLVESGYNKRNARSNRIMHFGKRTDDGLISEFDPESHTASKRVTNRIMHFGKRESALSSSLEDQLKRDFLEWRKRYTNRMHYFEKKRPQDRYTDKRITNRIMHFGKRGVIFPLSDETDNSSGKQKRQLKNSILHFGKRDDEMSIEKRTRNRIMHFGKREEGYPYENTLTSDKHLGDRILQFGKQEPHHQAADFLNKRSTANADLQFDNEDNGSPYLVDKKIPNRILHFGKRLDSAEDPGKVSGKPEQHVSSVNSDIKFEDSFLIEEHKPHNRRKRSLGFNQYDLDETLERVVHQLMDADYPKRVALGHPGIPGHLHLPHAFVAAHVYRSELPRMLSRPSRSDRFFPVPYSGEHREAPKGPSRNVFLHFG